MRDEYKDLDTRARYAWFCACYLGVWNFREIFETRRYMLCGTGHPVLLLVASLTELVEVHMLVLVLEQRCMAPSSCDSQKRMALLVGMPLYSDCSLESPRHS